MARRHRLVRERVEELAAECRDDPEAFWGCGACDATDSLQIRRSSLRPDPCADDVTLKCGECYAIRTHGIPVTRETMEHELALRGDGRTLDFVQDGPRGNVRADLEALGYIET